MGINNLDELKRENLCLHQTVEAHEQTIKVFEFANKDFAATLAEKEGEREIEKTIDDEAIIGYRIENKELRATTTAQAKRIEELRGALEKAKADVMMICPGLNRNNALQHIKQALKLKGKVE